MRIRKRLFVDHPVQRALMLRAVEYWFCCLLTVGLAHLVWNLLTTRYESLYEYFVDAWDFFLPAAIVSALVLPVLMYDILKLSNKFSGPLFRLRRELRRLAAGESVTPIRFRSDDFWLELADEFNATAQRMEMLAEMADKRSKTAEPTNRAGTKEKFPPSGPDSEKRHAVPSAPGAVDPSMLEEGSLPDQLFDLPRIKW
jgi:hypothetical protein